MRFSRFLVAAVVAAGAVGSVGCEQARRAMRGESAAVDPSLMPYEFEAEPTEDSLELPSDDNPKGMFEDGRTGTFSTQGRDIERSLGVNDSSW